MTHGLENAPGRAAQLERRTCGALALGGGALVLLCAAIFAATPRAAPFLVLGLGLYALISATVLMRIAAFHPHDRFGLPNLATLARGAIACLYLGLAMEALVVDGPFGLQAAWLLCAFAAVIGALDGIDGHMARRQKLESRFGARFDMEMDALFVLSLALLALAQGKVGPWILATGLMRYAFFGASLVWPPLARPLPPSLRRKAVCVLQVVALTLLLAPPVAGPAATLVGAVALAALTWSFAVDVVRLWRHRLDAI